LVDILTVGDGNGNNFFHDWVPYERHGLGVIFRGRSLVCMVVARYRVSVRVRIQSDGKSSRRYLRIFFRDGPSSRFVLTLSQLADMGSL
jgi:hypothetical protein